MHVYIGPQFHKLIILLDCVFSFKSIERKRLKPFMSRLFQIIFAHLGQTFSRSIFMLKIFGGLKYAVHEISLKAISKKNADHFIFNVGTNDLNSARDPEIIAKLIVDVNLSIKKEKDNEIISNIFIKNDDLKGKATETNGHLKLLRKERNLF